MDQVHLVQHVYESPDGAENIKLIGVYSDEEKAKEAVERLKLQPGFRDHPDGFYVSAVVLNQDHWTEGFVGWDEANRGASK
ncbi:DUF7336 domain-containing protein [Chondromyces apiculatus]|uniref:DUF7336 domain-containing protein n=1 Tax=Chondromyces apiculatus TaxID=51 RepID=UPI0009DFCCCD|nr:hypothetical protein [Chondromyces apiculatus]